MSALSSENGVVQDMSFPAMTRPCDVSGRTVHFFVLGCAAEEVAHAVLTSERMHAEVWPFEEGYLIRLMDGRHHDARGLLEETVNQVLEHRARVRWGLESDAT